MAYPTAPDKKIQKISNVLTKYTETEGVEFSFGNGDDQQVIYPLETFGFFGGLSLFLIEAKDVFEKTYNGLFTVEELMQSLGKKIKSPSMDQMILEENYLSTIKKEHVFPIDFVEQKEGTYFGFIPRISNDVPFDFVTMIHFVHHTVEEYIKVYKNNKELLVNGKIPLDPLYDKMMLKLNSKEILLKPEPISKNPVA